MKIELTAGECWEIRMALGWKSRQLRKDGQENQSNQLDKLADKIEEQEVTNGNPTE